MSDAEREHLARAFGAAAPALLLYARQWVDHHAAEDAVQEVFMRLLRRPPRRRDPDDDLRPLLFTAVRRIVADEQRGRRRRARRGRIAVERRAGDPPWFGDDPARRVFAAEVEAALGDLDEDQREIVVLRLWGGLTLACIAEIRGCAPATALRAYERAIEHLRRRLDSDRPARAAAVLPGDTDHVRP